MNYTQSIGNIVELQCISKFIEMGYEVSIPYGNGAKYDFVADVNGNFLRVQCKSCSHPRSKKDGEDYDMSAISISTISQTTNTQKTVRHLYTKEQIDYFATSYNGQIYLIPVEECSTTKTLRFSPPRNGSNNYNKAEDYEIEKIINYSDKLIASKEDFFKKTAPKQKDKQKESYCSCCGEKINFHSKTGLCMTCYYKTTRKTDRPTREELKALIRNESFLSIGKKYNVTDRAIRKWCEAENLPTKKGDIKMYTDEEWREI